MKITFTQTSDHLIDLWKNDLKQRKGWQLIMLLLVLPIAMNIVWSILQDGWNSTTLLNWLLPLFIMGSIGWLFIRRYKKRVFQADQEALVTGYREVELLEDGIRYKTDVSTTVFQWPAITKLAKSKQNYFVYMGAQRAIIIPKSAFETLEDQLIFMETINSKC